MSNRVKATAAWLAFLKECNPHTKNIQIYEKFFESMSDKDFKIFVDKCKNKEIILPYYAPNIEEKDVTVETCLKLAKKLNINFLQRVITTSHVTGIRKMSPVRYLVVTVPSRRQSQHVTKGKAIAETSRYIDNLSGQVIGNSKVAKLSQPELQLLQAQGFNNTIYELAGVRGGNVEGLKLARRNLISSGRYSLEEIQKTGNRAEAIQTANTILKAMLYESNL